jgi:Fe-S cluster assembly ATPase SufC
MLAGARAMRSCRARRPVKIDVEGMEMDALAGLSETIDRVRPPMRSTRPKKCLEIKNLHVKLEEEDKQILKGVDLTVEAGKVHAIMGPNGSGKSTLSYVLSGRDGYEVTDGSAELLGEDLLEMEPEERAAAGLFLAFQYPVEIPGVGNMTFLRTALNAQRKARGEEEVSAGDFLKLDPGEGEGSSDRRRHAEAARQRGLLRR